MKIQIIVAAHKKFRMPEDDIYLPLQVGAEGRESIGYVRDDTGTHISGRNPQYCELTGLYWAWKNLQADYIGLVHYRRYFTNPHVLLPGLHSERKLLDRQHLEKLLETQEIVLPRQRNYWIENLFTHYSHTHYAEHLIVTREILAERCPEYLESFDTVMGRTRAHMFNMMIMTGEKLDAYCSWLFPILEELEQRIDASEYDDFQARYPGRVSELLLNVWMEQGGYSCCELPVATLGHVQWGRKIASFLKAKLFGKKYDRSF